MDRVDPVLDNDVLVAAWRAARRGSVSGKDQAALTLVQDPSHTWLLTPTMYREFVKVARGSTSRKRFLRRLGNVSVLTSGAKALCSGARFVQVLNAIRHIANQCRAGLGDRPVPGGLKSNYNDIVNMAFAEELGLELVTADQKFLNFLSTYASHVGVRAQHFLHYP